MYCVVVGPKKKPRKLSCHQTRRAADEMLERVRSRKTSRGTNWYRDQNTARLLVTGTALRYWRPDGSAKR